MLGGTLPSATEQKLAAEYAAQRAPSLRAQQIAQPVHESPYSISESDVHAGHPQTPRTAPQLAILRELEQVRAERAHPSAASRILTTSNEGKERTGRADRYRDGYGARDVYRDVEPTPLIDAARPPRGVEHGLSSTKEPLCSLLVPVAVPDVPRQEYDETRSDHYFQRPIRAMQDHAIVPPSFMDPPHPAQVAAADMIEERFIDKNISNVGVQRREAGSGGVQRTAEEDPLSTRPTELFSNEMCTIQDPWEKCKRFVRRTWDILCFGAQNMDSDSGLIAWSTMIVVLVLIIVCIVSVTRQKHSSR
jgi:hypothetical protein